MQLNPAATNYKKFPWPPSKTEVKHLRTGIIHALKLGIQASRDPRSLTFILLTGGSRIKCMQDMIP